MTENETGTAVLDAAIAVHREPVPGLLETVYEVVLSRELQEPKSVERVTAAHKKQAQTYRRPTGCKPGYLPSSGEASMKDGITRGVNDLEE
jgi:hypothetical protein